MEVDKNKTKNEENDLDGEKKNEKGLSCSHDVLPNLKDIKTSLDSPICSTLTTLSPQSNQMASSSVIHNTSEIKSSKASDTEKTVPDKPQIYLLVKGPNEETYYQPLLLSQNNNIVVNHNTFSSQKNKIKNVTSKTKENSDLAINAERLFTNYVDVPNQSDKDKICIPEKEKDLSETIINENSEQIMKSSFHWFINEKKTKNRNVIPHELSTGTVNVFSEDSAMNEIITSLSSEFSEVQSNPDSESNLHKVNTTKSDSNDTMMMDSTDIFSLVINPTLYSPSERLSSEAFRDNFSCSNSEQQDSLFDNISDDALKELLFGTPE